MSFRKERKFRLTAYDAKALRAQLIDKGMQSLHPDRKISSQYFDTRDLIAFEQSEEGSLPRFKTRVRWYNDDTSALTFERKISSIEGRYKTTKKITPLEFDSMKRSGLIDQNYGRITPSVSISYRRAYFSYKDLRITFDTDIRYDFDEGLKVFRDFDEVVEIKAPFSVPDDYLERVVPVPTSRFSKYCRSFLHRDRAI